MSMSKQQPFPENKIMEDLLLDVTITESVHGSDGL